MAQWKKSNILVTKASYCAPDDLDLSNWKWLNCWVTTIEIALCGLIEAEGDRNSFQSIWMDVFSYCSLLTKILMPLVNPGE